ncbi:hypothetical protein B0T24DRAFT_690867, partial [Lasiosphaeria ovina]
AASSCLGTLIYSREFSLLTCIVTIWRSVNLFDSRTRNMADELSAKMSSESLSPKAPPHQHVDDVATNAGASSVDSRGNHRSRNGSRIRRSRNRSLRGNNGNNNGSRSNSIAASAPPEAMSWVPRETESKPVCLQLSLNIDIEVELKARLRGDVCVALL